MKKALLYKEMKKTKRVGLIVFLLGIILLAYIFIKLGRSFRFAGMEHLWDVIINRDQFVFRDIKFFPLLAGICIGLAQYVPEMIQKRIKLTLHLPLKERTTILLMLAHGLLLLLLLFTVHIGGTLIFAAIYFPLEFVYSTLITLAPWYLAGFTVYLFIAMICIEPTWKRRIFNIVLAAGTIQLFFISTFPGSYSHIIKWIIVLPVFILPFTFLSISRFKDGEQE